MTSSNPAGAPAPLELVCVAGDPLGHALLIARAHLGDAASRVSVRLVEPALDLGDSAARGPCSLIEIATGETLSTDPLAIAAKIAPELFAGGPAHDGLVAEIARDLIDGVHDLGRIEDQGAYQRAWDAWATTVRGLEARLTSSRFLMGNAPSDICFADMLLYTLLVRLDLVWFELYKANAFLLADLPACHGFCRDLYEQPAFYETTDLQATARWYYTRHPRLNPRGIVPRGGRPDLDAPHSRDQQHAETGTEEDQGARRGAGEWVRPQSAHRRWISADGSTEYPAVAGRYHLYAPYNCPWSHRALLARSIKGLDEVVGASVVYFRRDPDKGWQFNPRVPGCTPDQVYGHPFLTDLYERVGSSERSAPVLWDIVTETIVSNESAEILRMFNGAFGSLAARDIDLVPGQLEADIDRMNQLVYHRINNGAYKAGFASSQAAYDRGFARYFAALDWLSAHLGDSDWLLGASAPTEADLRLFPTVYRHDPVYYARFKLNRNRIRDMPRLQAWLDRMLAWPGVAEACNLDHARNGYFGRSGNQIVPAGPVPLGLSAADFPSDVWLNR